MTRFAKFILLGAALGAPCTSAFASSITDGQTVQANAISTPFFRGTAASPSPVIASTANSYSSGALTGMYKEMVYRDSTNTMAGCTSGQCLSFAIYVNDATNSGSNLADVTASSFSNAFTYNVGYSEMFGSAALASADDPATISFKAGVFQFNFAPTVKPGENTAFLIIQTNATYYGAGSLSVQDGTNTATVANATFAPAATPEPSSLVLLGTGLLSAAGAVLRKRSLV